MRHLSTKARPSRQVFSFRMARLLRLYAETRPLSPSKGRLIKSLMPQANTSSQALLTSMCISVSPA